jgi:hypothetical protein
MDVALGKQDPIAENLRCYSFDVSGLLEIIAFVDKDLCVRLGAASGISSQVGQWSNFAWFATSVPYHQ